MSLTSYRAAPPRVGYLACVLVWCVCRFGRPGGDRLSRVLRRSIIGAGGFHGRVRDGIGCGLPAMATRPSEPAGGGLAACLARGHDAGRLGGSGGCVCAEWVALRAAVSRMAAARGGWMEPIGRLGPVSCMRCRTSTPGLSTWWSTTALWETWF